MRTIRHLLLWFGTAYISLCMLGMSVFGGYILSKELGDNPSGLWTIGATGALFMVIGLIVGVVVWPAMFKANKYYDEVAQAKSEACPQELLA